jgi:Flp pilus assembly pilin Flp
VTQRRSQVLRHLAGPHKQHIPRNERRPVKRVARAFFVSLQDESGQELFVYALAAGMIALSIFIAVYQFGCTVENALNSLGNSMAGPI